MLALPRAAEIVRDISTDGVGDATGEFVGAGVVASDVEALGEAVGVSAGDVALLGATVVLEFEIIIWPPAITARPTIEKVASDFHEIVLRSVGILVTLFSTSKS